MLISSEYLRESPLDLQDSLPVCVSFLVFSPMNFSCFCIQNPSFVSFGSQLDMSLFPLLVLWLGNSLKAISWSSQGLTLLPAPISQSPLLHCLLSVSWKPLSCVFMFVFVSGMKLIPVPLSLSCLRVDALIPQRSFGLFFFFFFFGHCNPHTHSFCVTYIEIWTSCVYLCFYTAMHFLLEDNCFTVLCWFLPYLNSYAFLYTHEHI